MAVKIANNFMGLILLKLLLCKSLKKNNSHKKNNCKIFTFSDTHKTNNYSLNYFVTLVSESIDIQSAMEEVTSATAVVDLSGDSHLQVTKYL